jgi:tetratricopeptide (TPR) repeat protein
MANDAFARKSWSRLVVSLCSACIAVAGSSACTTHKVPKTEAAPQPPRSSSVSDVQDLERQLIATPNDLDLRSRVLKGYFLDRSPEGRTARARHALWVIENAPASDLAGSPETGFDHILDLDGYSRAKAIWQTNLRAHGSDARVVGNAATFFLFGDRAYAEELCKRAIELEPTNPKRRLRLASLYMLDSRRLNESDNPEAATKALAQYEIAITLIQDKRERSYSLPQTAEAARLAGEDRKASDYATEMLRLAGELPRDWNYGNAIHDGHRILGHVALNQGDTETAKAHLLSAGATPGSPQLNSFGPELTLAQALLDRGERDTVAEYLQNCSRFWQGRSKALNNWIAQIRAGESPRLNRFMARPSSS